MPVKLRLMSGWVPSDLLPGLYVASLVLLLAAFLRRWYDPLPWWVLGWFGAVLGLLFGGVLFGGEILLPLDNLRGFPPFEHLEPATPPGNHLQGDLLLLVAPAVAEMRRWLEAGQWPLWNPLVGAGLPLLADPHAQPFHPFILLASLFPLEQAAGVTAALRVLSALLFTFLLLRRQEVREWPALCGSLAYGLGGFMLLWLGWPLANSAALLPLLLYATVRAVDEGNRRDLVLLVTASLALALAGDGETLRYAFLFAAAMALDRLRARPGPERPRPLLRWMAGVALGLSLAAPVLLPKTAFSPLTAREALLEERTRWLSHMDPLGLETLGDPETRWAWLEGAKKRLIPLFAPNALGNDRYGHYWGATNINEDASGFPGTAPLFLALLAVGYPLRRGPDPFPQERLYAAVVGLGVLVLVRPPGFVQILDYLPLLGPSPAYHQRLLMLMVFCLASLAAFALERLLRSEEKRRWGLVAGGMVVAGLVAWAYLAHPMPEMPHLYRGFRARWMLLQLGALAAAMVLLTRCRRRWWGVGLAALTAAELLLFHGPANPPMPRRLAFPTPPPLAFLQGEAATSETSRMVGHRDALSPNLAGVYGLADIRIGGAMEPHAYHLATLGLRDRRPGAAPGFAHPQHPVYDLLGVEFVLAGGDVELDSPLEPVLAHETGRVYRRPYPLPLLFLPETVETYIGGEEEEDTPWEDWVATNPDFKARSLVSPSGRPEARWRASPNSTAEIRLERVAPVRVQAMGRLDEPRLLASSIYQEGGWRLLLNGKFQPTVLANGPFVGAWIPPGDWELHLIYRPRAFLPGCLLAGVALLATLVLGIPPPRQIREELFPEGA